MQRDDRVIVAGRIAAYFKIDPLAVLDSNYVNWAIRIAAYEVAVQEEKAAYERARNQQ